MTTSPLAPQTTRPALVSLAAGLVLAALAWVGPLFFPLALAGPLISGAVVAARGVALRWVVLSWVVAGLALLVSDVVVNQEDAVFHAALTLVMALLASAGYGAVRGSRRLLGGR